MRMVIWTTDWGVLQARPKWGMGGPFGRFISDSRKQGWELPLYKNIEGPRGLEKVKKKQFVK